MNVENPDPIAGDYISAPISTSKPQLRMSSVQKVLIKYSRKKLPCCTLLSLG